MDNISKRTNVLNTQIKEALKKINYEQLLIQLSQKENTINSPDFWNDPKKAASLSKNHSDLQQKIF